MYRSFDWKCVDPDAESAVCDENCKKDGETGGSFSTQFGQCICTYTTDCDTECDKNRAKGKIKRHEEGYTTMRYEDNGNSESFNITSELGIGDHDNDEHEFEFLFFDSSHKLSAFIPRSLEDVSDVINDRGQSQRPARRRRRAVGDNSTSAPPAAGLEIANPTICLIPGKALIFKIEINPINRSLSHYPRYRKNHLLNTNDEFDYGMLRE